MPRRKSAVEKCNIGEHITDEPSDDSILLPPKLSDDPNGRPVNVRSGADYAHRPVEWLWHKRIPIGKVTLLCGDPGLGKSLVALDMAARVTSGAPFPAPPCSNGSQPPALPGVCCGVGIVAVCAI